MNLKAYTPTAPSLLLQWLAYQPPRTLAQIRFACKSLAAASGIETDRAFYRIFMPLFRMGMVEFIGNGQYQLSPTTLLTTADGRATAINPGPILKRRLKTEYSATEPLYNILSFHCILPQLQRLARQHQVPVMQCKISAILARFPDVGSVVRHWKPVPIVFPVKYFYHPLTYKWIDEPLSFGIFRHSDSAHTHYFLDPEGTIRPIPFAELNPDGFAVAAAWQAALMNRHNLFYEPAIHELKITRLRLPALLERVLRLRELTFAPEWPEDQPETLIRHIAPAEEPLIRRILCQIN
jgi:hypothetical protein